MRALRNLPTSSLELALDLILALPEPALRSVIERLIDRLDDTSPDTDSEPGEDDEPDDDRESSLCWLLR